MTASAVPAFLTAFKTSLASRQGLEGVGVFAAPPGDELPTEALVVDRVTSEQEWAALGRMRREEGFVVFVVCHVAKAGAGEDVAAEARVRVYALKAELEDALRSDPGVGGSVRVASLIRDELRQGTGSGTRWAQLEMQVECRQRI